MQGNRTAPYRIEGSPDPLREPITDPLYKAVFPYRVRGYWEGTERVLLFEVHAQRQPLYAYAERACRLLLECYQLVQTRLGLEHSLRYGQTLRVFLMVEGKPGAEQQQNLLYLYDLTKQVPPREWVRELTHEYGHWIVPPINSFVEPEAWANGDLGERWLLYHLREGVQAGTIPSSALMGASVDDLERYLRRAYHPLVERMAREGLNSARWRSRRRAGYEEYLALALYADQVYGSALLGRAMRIAGGVEPDDFLRGLRESLLERETLTVRLPTNPCWLMLPAGPKFWQVAAPYRVQLIPDPKRPDWVRVQSPTLELTLRQRHAR